MSTDLSSNPQLSRLRAIANRLRDSGRYGDISADIADASEVDDAAAEIERLTAERDEARSRVISGFYHEEVPQFQQGYPNHEVLEFVSAEDCKSWIKRINELRAEIEHLTVELEMSHQAEVNAFRNRDSAIAENDRLREALGWYARNMGQSKSMDYRISAEDGGKRARDALAGASDEPGDTNG